MMLPTAKIDIGLSMHSYTDTFLLRLLKIEKMSQFQLHQPWQPYLVATLYSTDGVLVCVLESESKVSNIIAYTV